MLYLVKHLSGDRDCIRVVCRFTGILLISYGRCKKNSTNLVDQKNIYICSFAVTEVSCLKSVSLGQFQDVNRATFPLETIQENPFLALPTSGGYWHSYPCGCLIPITASMATWPSPLPCEIFLCLSFDDFWKRAQDS